MADVDPPVRTDSPVRTAPDLSFLVDHLSHALATRMAHSTEEVLAFLRELAQAARGAAQAEFAELEQFAGRKLAAWDVAVPANGKTELSASFVTRF